MKNEDMTVDFGYAFATPHRLTVCLPDASDKTLLDAQAGWLRMAWTYDNLRDRPLAAFMPPTAYREVHLRPEVDGRPFATSRWTRCEGWLPALENTYEDGKTSLRLEIVGGRRAAVVRIEAVNEDRASHRLALRCDKGGYNPGWVHPDADRDVILAGLRARADRIVLLAVGGADKPPSGSDKLCMAWDLRPGEKRTGWMVRPYEAYEADLPDWRRQDWAREFEQSKAAWRSLLDRAAGFVIPDESVQNAFQACVADCFVMREPVADGSVVACPGTEVYRSPNPFEPLIVSVLFDQLGLHEEAAGNTRMFLEQQGADGNWADPQGWVHHMWGASGIKAWAVMEHYRLTGDPSLLAAAYPRMVASSRWQETQRARTRVLVAGRRPLTYGLMPRGMGDCGLAGEDGSAYGVFLPHNILAVYGDALTVEAAEILGKTGELPELRGICQRAHEDLVDALARGAVAEDGYRWIPGVPGHAIGSRWGALYAAFPCRILPPGHELITGTLRKCESRMSPGGIPVHTGWMKDGMWVAITLDNLAEVLLLRGEGDAAARYLYATLNHGTPLLTWCEERGQAPNTQECSGDRQHLWTPVAVGRIVRDMLVMEDGDTLHLALGSARPWLEQGQKIAVRNAPTHFGSVSCEIVSDVDHDRIRATVQLPARRPPGAVVLHLRHPAAARIASAQVNGEDWQDIEGEAVRLTGLAGTVTVTATYQESPAGR